MIPFAVLVVLLCCYMLRAASVYPFRTAGGPRFAWLLSGMFLLTASAHWGKRRPDLIRMVPPAFPRPDLLVTVTGVLELLGAIGLMLPATAPYAALGLALLLLAVFPANIHAARNHQTIAGRPVESALPPRFCKSYFWRQR